MAIIGGMDLGYGSQTKLIRTNFLCTKMTADSSAQALSNMLTLVNRRLPTNMQCDYIVTEFSNQVITPNDLAPGGQEFSVIVQYGRRATVALMGPSFDALAARQGIATAAGDGGAPSFSANKVTGHIHMITSLNACKITADSAGDNFDGFAAIVLGPPTSNDAHMVEDANSKLLDKLMEGAGSVGVADLSEPLEVINGAGLSTVDYTDAALTTDFIPEGNAAGVTPTTFTSLDSIINNKVFAILSVTAITQTAQ